MGNTTIIALNHDIYDEIERDPAGWANGILMHMRGHSYSSQVRIPGGEIVCTFHRGTADEAKPWDEFRQWVIRQQDRRHDWQERLVKAARQRSSDPDSAE